MALSILSSVGKAITGIGNLGLNATGLYLDNKMNQQNLQLQKEQFEYQKNLQQQVFNREDTAYQRAKSDAVSAGFSPLVAAGVSAGGSGSVVSTTAPQGQSNMQMGLAQMIPSLSAGLDLERKRVENENIEAQTEKTNQETAFSKWNMGFLSNQQKWNILLADKQFEENKSQFESRLRFDKDAQKEARSLVELSHKFAKELEDGKLANSKDLASWNSMLKVLEHKGMLDNASFTNMGFAEKVAFIIQNVDTALSAVNKATTSLSDLNPLSSLFKKFGKKK